jgi:hypothetical protein
VETYRTENLLSLTDFQTKFPVAMREALNNICQLPTGRHECKTKLMSERRYVKSGDDDDEDEHHRGKGVKFGDHVINLDSILQSQRNKRLHTHHIQIIFTTQIRNDVDEYLCDHNIE